MPNNPRYNRVNTTINPAINPNVQSSTAGQDRFKTTLKDLQSQPVYATPAMSALPLAYTRGPNKFDSIEQKKKAATAGNGKSNNNKKNATSKKMQNKMMLPASRKTTNPMTVRSAAVYTWLHRPSDGQTRVVRSASPTAKGTTVGEGVEDVEKGRGTTQLQHQTHGDVVNTYKDDGYKVEHTWGTGRHATGSGGEHWITLDDGRHVLIGG